MESERIHILVLPYPIQGHINPMLQFSKRLASKGLKVTFLLPSSITKTTQIQAASDVAIDSISDGSYAGDHPETPLAYLARFTAAVPQSLCELIVSDRRRAEILVYDSTLPWALEVVHRCGVRGASFFTQSGAVNAIYYHFREGHFRVPVEEGTRVSLPAMPVLEKDELPSFVNDAGSYPALLSLVVDQFSNFQKADWLFFNTFDKLEEQILKWMMENQWPIKTIGPTIPSKYMDKRLEDDKDYGLNLFNPKAEACMKWLDTKEKASVVYTSFGSLATLSQPQMEELAWGLKNTGRPFLWVVRASEETKLPPGTFAGGEERTPPEKGLVVNWCPQLEVLAHRAVGCFVTHCGWNSTLEGLSSGVPMVALPQWTDQATNAKFIADEWGIGLRVRVNDKGIVTREEIEFSIKEVMEGERGKEMRRKAVLWKELAKEAVDEGGSSDKNIEEFVSKLVHLP